MVIFEGITTSMIIYYLFSKIRKNKMGVMLSQKKLKLALLASLLIIVIGGC